MTALFVAVVAGEALALHVLMKRLHRIEHSAQFNGLIRASRLSVSRAHATLDRLEALVNGDQQVGNGVGAGQ